MAAVGIPSQLATAAATLSLVLFDAFYIHLNFQLGDVHNPGEAIERTER